MSGKIAIGVSACLLGEKVRYDGGHKHDPYITGVLGEMFTLVPVCPEVECGMPVPREPMRLEEEPENPRLVTVEGWVDMSGRMLAYCHAKLGELERMELCGFILKARSPSCGLSVDVYVSGTPAGKGRGLFAAAVLRNFPLLPVVEEDGLNDQGTRERFIEEVYECYRRLNSEK